MAEVVDFPPGKLNQAHAEPEVWQCQHCRLPDMRLLWTGKAVCAHCGVEQDLVWDALWVGDGDMDEITQMMTATGLDFCDAVKVLAARKS